jgi:COP9 signalosome complex subunit 5
LPKLQEKFITLFARVFVFTDNRARTQGKKFVPLLQEKGSMNSDPKPGSSTATGNGNIPSSSTSQASIAMRTWEMENNIENTAADDIYRYDKKQQQDILTTKPWERDPHFFKDIKISALGLLKMVMHARSGGTLEVMGLLLGKVDGNTMIVMDCFALPVEGTETRVNAQAQAYEYMTAYIEAAKSVGRLENAIGWYHSHPGYGCWLSGIDVSTQMLNQNYQEPFVAIVIDPVRTISAGKVCLGAFRTYPKGYKPPSDEPSEYQTIPLNKIEDFGVHCKSYYPLDITYFKSGLDRRLLESLWNKYWVNTLSSSSLLTNAEYTTGQIFDLSDKLEQSETSLGRTGMMLSLDPGEKKSEDKLTKATKDSCKITAEVIHGLMSQVIKNRLFNHAVCNPNNAPQAMDQQ